jgi:transposase
MKRYVGVDISKSELVCAFPVQEGFAIKTFKNDPEGIGLLLQELDGSDHAVVEATGNYSSLLAYSLHEAGRQVSVINPKQSAYYFKMQLQITKTDAKDAEMLSSYGKTFEPPVFSPKSSSLLKIQHKRMVIRQLKKQRHAMGCLQKEEECLVQQDPLSKEVLSESVGFIDEQIALLEDDLLRLAKEEFDQMLKLAVTVKGIGDKIAISLIVATDGFRLFDTAKQLAKFIGIAPTHHQSGTSVRVNRGINRSGDPTVRSLLFMGAWSAIKYNKACKAMYERLKSAGKPSYVALVAVCHKLVRQVFAVVKNGVPFDNEYEVNSKKTVDNLAL